MNTNLTGLRRKLDESCRKGYEKIFSSAKGHWMVLLFPHGREIHFAYFNVYIYSNIYIYIYIYNIYIYIYIYLYIYIYIYIYYFNSG